MYNKPRAPDIAVLLSIIWPGLGHIYAGSAKKGLMLLSVISIFVVPFAIALIYFLPSVVGHILIIICFLSLFVYVIADALRLARKGKYKYDLKRYNRWYLYLLIIFLYGFIILPISNGLFKISLVQAYKFPSISSTPTILKGDQILVSKISYKNSEPEKGDMILFQYPKDPSKVFIKRIIGTEDDKIEIKDDRLYINGEKVPLEKLGEYTDEYMKSAEEYLERLGEKSYHIIDTNYRSDNFGPILVPKKSLFVLGDNRDYSEDSRFWGFVEKDKVIGKVLKIYWSWDSVNKRVRWERIGKHIE